MTSYTIDWWDKCWISTFSSLSETMFESLNNPVISQRLSNESSVFLPQSGFQNVEDVGRNGSRGGRGVWHEVKVIQLLYNRINEFCPVNAINVSHVKKINLTGNIFQNFSLLKHDNYYLSRSFVNIVSKYLENNFKLNCLGVPTININNNEFFLLF